MKRTPLYQEHLEANGKMVPFAGWEMPIHYGSQLDEHHAVRQDAGMFDVSHMCIIDIMGSEVRPYLRYLLANNIDKLKTPGKALYSCMLNADGHVIDDLIVYKVNDNHYRTVVNAGTWEKDLKWMQHHAQSFDLALTQRAQDSIIAIQGPNAIEKVCAVLPDFSEALQSLKVFQGIAYQDWWIARTGYTGEDGLEIMLPNKEAIDFWQQLLNHGVTPCGLGARDTLRLEAGMNLYGQDMDETTSPLESGLDWTIAFEPAERNFIGRELLTHQKETGLKQQLVGIMLDDRGVLRHGQRVVTAEGEGLTTSGTFSPTLKQAIALARLPLPIPSRCRVEIRGKLLPATVVKIPFVRKGQPAFKTVE